MALIGGFIAVERQRTRRQEKVEAGFLVVATPEGPLLQIETYGSAGRRLPGKTSQVLQFDRNAAFELVRIIEQVFGESADGGRGSFRHQSRNGS